MFLHLVDDEKFTDGSADLFEACDPGNHRYVIVCSNNPAQFRYIKKTNVQIIRYESEEYRSLTQTLSDYTAVFVYSLFNKYHLDLVNKAPTEAVLVWFFGGGELLTTKKYWPTVMLPRTRLLYYKHRAIPWLKTNFYKYINLLRQGKVIALAQPLRKLMVSGRSPGDSALDTHLEKAIARMDYIAPVIPEDYEQLKKMVPCNAEIVNWNYSAGFSLCNMESWRVTGNNWLVGNASRYALNHIEMFRLLNKIKGHQGDVIVPLSYGDNELYKNDILRAGNHFFGKQFRPLLDYMPIEDYYATIRTCSAAFFNTPRQHAMGNIIRVLYIGARVFLREENPGYQFFKRYGAKVFSIQTDIPRTAETIDVPLDMTTIQQNRNAIVRIASEQVLQDKTLRMLTILKERLNAKK